MDFLQKNKKIIGIVIVVLIVIVLVVVLDKRSVQGYILVSSDQDMQEKINEEFFVIKDQELSLDELYDLSFSYLMGYYYLYQLQENGSISIENLDKKEQAQLVYLLATSGEESVCFSKKYFQELVDRYLGISNFKVKFSGDGYYGKNNLFHGYCFEQYFIDLFSEFNFINYEKNGDILTFSYLEEMDGYDIRTWNINFFNKDGRYYLNSLSAE